LRKKGRDDGKLQSKRNSEKEGEWFAGPTNKQVHLVQFGRAASCCGNTEEALPEEKAPRKGLNGTKESKIINKKVYESYQSGFHCAEAISRSVLEIFSNGDFGHLVKAASAFGGGIVGSTGEPCGAFSRGVMALGYLTQLKKIGE
jgi:hypothetical protein